jgi:tetratricopeptide (TPR) repeat protein
MKEPDKAMQAFLKSFEFDLPRAELCCEIGYLFKAKEDYERAIFWFELALSLKKPENSWGFFFHDYWGYIPAIELSICHYGLGHLKEAFQYNEEAGVWKPNDASVIYNRRFYQTLNSQPSKIEENP